MLDVVGSVCFGAGGSPAASSPFDGCADAPAASGCGLSVCGFSPAEGTVFFWLPHPAAENNRIEATADAAAARRRQVFRMAPILGSAKCPNKDDAPSA